MKRHDSGVMRLSASQFPGPGGARVTADFKKLFSRSVYCVLDIPRCEGMWLVTVDGQRLFDWTGYYGSKLIAHNHPGLYEPEYVRRLTFAANNKIANPDFLTPECLEYYEALYSIRPKPMRSSPDLQIFAVNSGSEAMENMLKYFAHQYEAREGGAGSRGSRRFIFFDQAFHGRTMLALSVTQLGHDPLVTRDFHGFIPGNLRAPFPAVDTSATPAENFARTEEALARLRDLLETHRHEIVGIVVEPLQGAGGHRVALPEFFRSLSKLAHAYDVPLGFDEVQTAGCTGDTFFAIDDFDLPYAPAAVASGKKLGNGVLYMLHPCADGILDSTWGGSLVDMVRFVRELEIVREERLLEQVHEKEAALVAMLERITRTYGELVTNVRGLGIYQGFSLRKPKYQQLLIEIAFQEEATLLLGTADDAIRLRPSLSVSLDDIARLERRLARALD